jgi:hypothetical protein
MSMTNDPMWLICQWFCQDLWFFFGDPTVGKFVWDLNPSCRSLGILSPQSFDRWLMGNVGNWWQTWDSHRHKMMGNTIDLYKNHPINLFMLIWSLEFIGYIYISNRWLHGHSQNILVIVGLNPSPVIIDCHDFRSCGLCWLTTFTTALSTNICTI